VGFTLPVWSVSHGMRASGWSCFLHELVKASVLSLVFGVFELHEFHGLHVHCVGEYVLPVNRFGALVARDCGWGRIHVQQMQPGAFIMSPSMWATSKRDGAF